MKRQRGKGDECVFVVACEYLYDYNRQPLHPPPRVCGFMMSLFINQKKRKNDHQHGDRLSCDDTTRSTDAMTLCNCGDLARKMEQEAPRLTRQTSAERAAKAKVRIAHNVVLFRDQTIDLTIRICDASFSRSGRLRERRRKRRRYC